MLNSEKVLFALNDTDENYLESARIRLDYRTREDVKRPARKRIVAFALAAALILGLGAAVYAADLFGVRALLMENAAPTDEPGGGTLSLTQPQDVPEEMDDAIRQKIDNSPAPRAAVPSASGTPGAGTTAFSSRRSSHRRRGPAQPNSWRTTTAP